MDDRVVAFGNTPLTQKSYNQRSECNNMDQHDRTIIPKHTHNKLYDQAENKEINV